jgi:hypothetical protein
MHSETHDHAVRAHTCNAQTPNVVAAGIKKLEPVEAAD